MRALDAAAVHRWADACVHDLRALRADIDGINVYPVADSDTGSNLLHTVTAARAAVAEVAAGDGLSGAGHALTVLARAAVRAARGNSGIILSQVLRGLAESAGDAAELDGPTLAAALRRADTVATGAVARPVAGTMLSVLHAVAAAVGDADPAHRPAGTGGAGGTGGGAAPGGDPGEAAIATVTPAHGPGTLAEVATTAARAAAAALAETPNQLAALAVAGVVDAGGRGLVAVLDALVGVVGGTRNEPRVLDTGVAPAPPAPRAWEVMYLLTVAGSGPAARATDAPLPELRRALSALGDSVTVAGAGDGEYAVHVHCADIGAAIEAGLRHGRPHQVRVEPLVTPAPADSAVPRGDRAVVAVVHGDALADLVAAEGAPVLAVAAGTEPTAEQLLGLITETAATHVAVLPGGVRLTAAAEGISAHPVLADRDVVVVPCASPVQVLAALAVHDPDRRAGADVVAMAEAAAATRRGDIVLAAQDAITWVGRAAAGDVVGLIDGEVVLIQPGGARRPQEWGRAVERAALDVLDRMLAVGGELVTVLVGVDAPEGIADVLTEHLRAERPEVELVCYSGGQTDALLLMGVE